MAQIEGSLICGLNLTANPHPPGIYPQLLRAAAKTLVQARGSDYAKITTPRKYERADHLYSGRILVWTDIDVAGKWLDLSNEAELPPNLKNMINIPPNAKPNYRTFDYVFDDKRHNLWFQSKNELLQTLGPTTARRIFATLLSQEVLGHNSPEVEVTIIPEDGAVDRILSLPRLDVLTIRVTRPNPDASTPQARRRVFQRLEEANAQQMDVRLKRSKGVARLNPTADFAELAHVGADTGFVTGEEKGQDGKRHTLSTNDLPKRIYVEDTFGGSFIARVFSKLHL